MILALIMCYLKAVFFVFVSEGEFMQSGDPMIFWLHLCRRILNVMIIHGTNEDQTLCTLSVLHASLMDTHTHMQVDTSV